MQGLGFLYKPTVKEMIFFLQSLPQELPIRIEDADTNWNILKIHFEIYHGRVVMFGKYEEMQDEPEIGVDP